MKKIWQLIALMNGFFKKMKEDSISAYAAQSAFFIILSMIPFLMLLSSLIQYTVITPNMIYKVVNGVMPDYIKSFAFSLVDEAFSQSVGLISASAVVAIWSAAKSVQYLSGGFNSVYDVNETRNWFILRFRAVIYTLIFLVAIVLSLTLLIFGNKIESFFAKYLPILSTLVQVIIQLRALILFVVFVFFFAVVYKVLPNRKATFKSQLPGAILCGIAWIGFSGGLSIYIDYFNGFSMYGSLTTIVLVMLWLYICMYIVLVCAEINCYFEDYFIRFWKKY